MSAFSQLLNSSTGEDISLMPDKILINDASGSQDIKENQKVADTVIPHLVVGFDHDVPTGTPASSAVYQKLAHFADNNQLSLIHAQGILYLHVLSQLQGPIIVASTGNHNGIFGCKGSLGIKISDQELKDLLDGKAIQRKVPERLTAEFQGKRNENITSADIAINVWNQLQNKDLKGKLIQFVDSSHQLNDEDKQVISSMSTLFGAFSSLFVDQFKESEITLQLDSMQEMVILPSTADKPVDHIQVQNLSEVSDIPFKVGFIGGFTGGNINDLRLAAKLVDGKHIAFGKRLNICPASSDIYLQALNEGLITKFIDFGAQMVATGDKSVVKQGAGIVGDGEVVMSTGSYNYSGCLYAKKAQIYLGSVKAVINAML